VIICGRLIAYPEADNLKRRAMKTNETDLVQNVLARNRPNSHVDSREFAARVQYRVPKTGEEFSSSSLRS